MLLAQPPCSHQRIGKPKRPLSMDHTSASGKLRMRRQPLGRWRDLETGRAGPSSLGGDQDLKFRALDNQTVQEGPKLSGMVLSKVNLEIGEAAPSFVYEEATWILRI